MQALLRIEALLAGEQARRETLEQGVALLRRQVAELQARLAELENRLRAP